MRSALFVLCAGLSLSAQTKPSYNDVARAIRAGGSAEGVSLADAFGEENLKSGRAVLYRGGELLFAVRSTREPKLVIDEASPVGMTRVGGQDLWVKAVTVPTSTSHNFYYLVAEERFGGRNDVPAFGPWSYDKDGVPKGTLSEKLVHKSSVYPGLECNWWIYAPAQYDKSKPAAVMVWQDGQGMTEREGSRAQIVFDNLTAEGRIPVIVHVFIQPGTVGGKPWRSIQYDSVDDRYPRFLLEEILPQVAKRYNIRTDGYSRAIAGNSSGGICAFNAAWQKPDEFSRVLSRIGSFTSIQWHPGEKDGGNLFPFMIRKQPKRNIRVWLQDGSGDLENNHGSWPLQNVAMANSLKMKDYDYHLSWGNGTHSGAHGNAEIGEEMIWLWRGYDPAVTRADYVQDAAERQKPMWRVRQLNRD
ncbi:MAG TPA: alpha/beta hydrolase-fold protein [Bryobacteraceae bacterium]|nr:alpha/beta hydrolase-fold protein [Bryobacteraceae bacterium]